ncbi:hypothetical protein JTE90_002835 [Oedothorax gibbosus]|uniref:Uncharacterized protein n=1 Tax=Oedothorax gibbosus TaxID=931172 RepID=A0AAV6UI79_9ARAC|nr:hypothetical protein JTE90_002835 [Oedothorax gibbosus]
MNCYRKLRKDELKSLADELGLECVAGARVIDFKKFIEGSSIFNDDPDFVEIMATNIFQERSHDPMEPEKLKLKRVEAELE